MKRKTYQNSIKNSIKKKEMKVSEKELYAAYKLFFNTFSSEHRLKILNLLRKRAMNVSEIVKYTGLKQSIVSHNLHRLKSCGFVDYKINGKYRYYFINKPTIEKIMKLIDEHMKKNCILIIKGLKKTTPNTEK